MDASNSETTEVWVGFLSKQLVFTEALTIMYLLLLLPGLAELKIIVLQTHLRLQCTHRPDPNPFIKFLYEFRHLSEMKMY